MTRSAGNEKSTSMPRPSLLKSSSTFGSLKALPSASRSAMKSIDQVTFGLSGMARASGTSSLQALARLDPQVQLHDAVDAVDAFVVPEMPLHVPQVQKTQPEAPRLARVCQADQQVSDQLVLIAEQRTVAIARLSHTERSAGKCDADPSMFYGLGGHLATLRWPSHFFPRASFSRSGCMLRSANMRFRRRFSSSRLFIWLIMDASMPPYFARHL